MVDHSRARFETFKVVNRHTGEVVSKGHETRAAAEQHKTDPAHRVVGARPVRPKGSQTRMGDVLRQLARLNRGEE